MPKSTLYFWDKPPAPAKEQAANCRNFDSSALVSHPHDQEFLSYYSTCWESFTSCLCLAFTLTALVQDSFSICHISDASRMSFLLLKFLSSLPPPHTQYCPSNPPKPTSHMFFLQKPFNDSPHYAEEKFYESA